MPPSRRTLRRRERPRADMESAPTANGKRRGQPGKNNLRVIANLCRGRCSHRPGNPAAAQGSAGGINPAPTVHGQRPANRNGRVYPGGRRAGCPHPAGLCAGANARGRIWNPPLQPTENAAANRESTTFASLQTSVGDDARTAPAGAFRRPTGPQGPALRPEIVPGTLRRRRVPRAG